jgi:two-component system, NtrC family, sensor histidine kinase HydH
MPPAQPTFNLSRWFALAALLSITALAVAVSTLLTWFVTSRMLAQEAETTRQFVGGLMVVETPLRAYIANPSPALEAEMALSFQHIKQMPDVLRANVYDRAQRVIWSSDTAMVGRQFGPNDELEQALAGQLMIERASPHPGAGGKAEHTALRGADDVFLEIYVPVHDAAEQKVIGAIEFYKRPRALAAALSQLRVYIIVGAAVGALLLFLALFGLVRRADRTIRSQHRLLVEQSTLAALGQMSGAVAHGIRNPLASIRSSAELIPGAGETRASEAAHDIMAQTDRLEAWVRELLSYTQPLDASATPVALEPLVKRCLKDFAPDFAQRRIEASVEMAPGLPAVRGDAMLLTQVLRSLITNAIEAMDGKGRGGTGGQLRISVARGQGAGVTLEVRDSGPGLTPEQLARVGRPFYTTKPRGLGVGLALARRVAEGSGGRLDIDSAPGHGTAVRLRLQAL